MTILRKTILIMVVVGLAAAGYWIYRSYEKKSHDYDGLILYGNVDVRQVYLGFRVPGRIEKILVDEGDAVKTGDLLAALDATGYTAAKGSIVSDIARAAAELEKLHNGTRKEEIEQARAALDLAKAANVNAEKQYARDVIVAEGDALPERDVDVSRSWRDETAAAVRYAAAHLRLLESGFRYEEIEAAAAELEVLKSKLVSAEFDLADTSLYSPSEGIIRTRVQEEGAVVGSGTTVFTLTLHTPVWVRAYVSEPDKGLIHPGMEVEVYTDSSPEPYTGSIGFISPTAEFTPKSVETASLRTDLVYRIRIVVADPARGLLQGMPVTVKIPRAH